MSLQLTLPGQVAGATLTKADLPFSHANEVFWANGNGAVPSLSDPTRVDRLVGRTNGADYTVVSGTARIGSPGVVNGKKVISSRFYEVGSTSGADGYQVPTSIMANRYAIGGISRRGPAAAETLNGLFRVGNSSEVLLVLRYYLSGFDVVARRAAADMAPTVRVPIADPTKFDWFLLEVDNLTGAVSLQVNDTTVLAMLATTGAPVLPASSNALICSRSADQLRGQIGDQVGFSAALEARQRKDLIDYLKAKRAALNAA